VGSSSTAGSAGSAGAPGEERTDFFDLYAHGFVRVAAAVPTVALADPAANARRILELYERGAAAGASVVCLPELCLSGYAIDDLLQQDALLDAVRAGLERLAEATRSRAPLLVVGAPLRFRGRLFNCAVVLAGGVPLGVAPKTYLPNYREFYERRQFASARDAVRPTIRVAGEEAPFGNDLVFEAEDYAGFALHVEICEDLWVPLPPSTTAALGGATVLANLSASNVTIGKSEYRRALVAGQSGKCVAAYLYSAAGPGESTTDLTWDGQSMIYENAEPLAESERFPDGPRLITADVDLERLRQERMRLTTFSECAGEHGDRARRLRRIAFRLDPPAGEVPLERAVERFPFVPANAATRDERCYEAYNIQVQGLAQRLAATGIRRVVLGVSGGLDSTQALIVAAKTFDRLGWPRRDILGYSMPGFATSGRTRANALALMKALGVSAEEIDIRPSARQMLADIGHPAASGEAVYDVTFENVQAGERTSHLFRLANRHDALVVGTGDLSELALGWTTYGVGDHMSHYNDNASVPKTLIQHLIGWMSGSKEFDGETAKVLQRVLATEISPELVPNQKTESAVGPYELQDFNLYYTLRFGYTPAKIAFLAAHAWQGKYSLGEIRKWLGVFLKRFFQTSQFKRSAMPNAPKVGSGGSLSPRGDWRAPSDGNAEAWLADLKKVPSK
jgi:NAD+ synthase (glutamine-hydrolysing)